MIQLTRNNTNIQKIVAFENAFERLFDIIRDEGNCDGGQKQIECFVLCLVIAIIINYVFSPDTQAIIYRICLYGCFSTELGLTEFPAVCHHLFWQRIFRNQCHVSDDHFVTQVSKH